MAIDPLGRPATILPQYEAQPDTLPLARINTGFRREQQAQQVRDALKQKLMNVKALKYMPEDHQFFQKAWDDVQKLTTDWQAKGFDPFDQANPKNREANQQLVNALVQMEEWANMSARQDAISQDAAKLYSNPDKFDLTASNDLNSKYRNMAGDAGIPNPIARQQFKEPFFVERQKKMDLFAPVKEIAGTSAASTVEEGATTTKSKAADAKTIGANVDAYLQTEVGAKYAADNFEGDTEAAKEFLTKQIAGKVGKEYAKTLDEEKAGMEFKSGDGWSSGAGYRAEYVSQGSGIKTKGLEFAGIKNIMPQVEKVIKDKDGILITSSVNGKDPQPQRWNPVSGSNTTDLFRPYFIYEDKGKLYVMGETIKQQKKKNAAGEETGDLFEEKADATFELVPGGNKENFEKVFPAAGDQLRKFEQQKKGGVTQSNATKQPSEDDYIKSILTFEKNKGYDNFGFTSEPSGSVKTIDQATQKFKNEYLPIIKDLPLPLQAVAGDFAFNSEDPRASLMVAAGFITPEEKINLYTNGKLDKAKVDKLWNGGGYGRVDSEYAGDSKGFLDAFDKERLRSYQNTKGADKYLPEWKERVKVSRAVADKLLSQGNSGQTQTKPQPPKVGDIVKGYKYLGGDPANPKSWQKQ